MIGAGIRAVLLDAHGTLVHLVDPVGALGEALARAGAPRPRETVATALAAEVRHYRAHHDEGRDAPSLARLRLECAAVLGDALGPPLPRAPELSDVLQGALRFAPYPEVADTLDALRREGLRLAVVSNWDCSLPDVLAGLGLSERVDAVLTSARVGASKPSAAIFRSALDLLGVGSAAAVHVGDDPAADVGGARAAGLAAVLLRRAGGPAPPGVPVIDRLDALLGARALGRAG